MPDLSVVYNKAGDAFVGFDHEGAFVTVATVSATNIASAVVRHAELSELGKSKDADAQARHDHAAELRPYTSKQPRKKKDNGDNGEEG